MTITITTIDGEVYARPVGDDIGPVFLGDLSDALALYDKLDAALRDAPWPRLIVVTVPDEDQLHDSPEQLLQCPRCGRMDVEVISEDRSIRWTNLEADMSRDVVQGDYGGHGDYNGFLYRCVGCAKPVRLPEGWEEL